MRVLVLPSPVSTHLAPLIPLCWALRAAGHEVLVAGQPDVLPTAHAAGLATAVVGGEYGEVARRRARGNSPAPPAAATTEPPWEKLAASWRERMAEHLPPMLALGRAWRPDLVVSDTQQVGATLVAGALGVPAVHHRWGVDPVGTETRRRARTALHATAVAAGLPGVPEPALVLDPCPPRLQSPKAAPGTPIRFVPHNGAGTPPPWAARRAGRRRICVTFGRRTLALDGLAVVHRIVTAAAALSGVDTVVTVDAGLRDQVGPVPPNIHVVDPVPIDLVLNGCDAVVHHGGSGTGMTALAFGLPQLVLPEGFPFVAEHGRQVAACGAGLTLSGPPAADPRALRAALDALLTDPALAAGARALSGAIAAMPAPGDLVPTLERLAA